MPILQTPDTPLFYADQGQGRPVLFLHGLWESSRFFHRQLTHFGRNYHAIAPDMRGHGQSAQPSHGHTVAQYARDVRALVEGLELRDVVLVGHSMGAFVAWDYLRQFGTAGVRGMVVVDQSASDFRWPDWELGYIDFADLCWFMAALQTDRAALVREITPQLFKDPPAEADLRPMLAEIERVPESSAGAILFDQTVQDYRPFLRDFNVPTLLCFGRDEKAVPVAAGEHLVQNLPDARLVIFEASGHYPFLEEPERFNAEVESFLASLK